MKTGPHTEDILCFLLMLCFFYEGSFLIMRRELFDLWLKYLPLMSKVHQPISFLLPVAEMLIALLIIIPRTRHRGLWLALTGCLAVLMYLVTALLFSNKFFLVFHPYWKFMKWFHKMLLLLGVLWTVFLLLVTGAKEKAGQKPRKTVFQG